MIQIIRGLLRIVMILLALLGLYYMAAGIIWLIVSFGGHLTI